MAKFIATQDINQSDYLGYKDKAKSLFQMTEIAYYEEKLWDAVAINGIHCCICASDSLIAYYHSKRVTAKDHLLSAEYLGRLELKDTKKYSNTLSDIIRKKNMAEYTAKQLTEKDADTIFKKVYIHFS
tara:strand:- start:357 stop:740 length:384 start_codon:yes stop_codon:yes gene_type:complete